MSFPNLSALAVRERAVTLFFLILSALAGLYAFLGLGRAEDPAFTVRILMVSALWPGATAPQMEEQVAHRLEKRLQELEYLYRLTTTVQPGRVDIQVEFEEYVPQREIGRLFYEVRKRMWDEASTLPQGVIGPIVNDDFSDVYFSLMALTAPGLPPWDLVREAEALRDRLARVPGVQKALLIGEQPERIFLELDLDRLIQLGLTPQAVFEAIDANNALVPAGFLDTGGPRVYVRLPGADLSEMDRIAAVPLRVGGRILTVGELGTVRLGVEDPPSFLVRAHGEEAILLGVVMQRGENGLELGKRLARFVAEEEARLPAGMDLSVLTNQAEAIAQAVDLFQVKFLVAVAVVMGVTFLTLGWRAGVVVAVAIPVTLGLTFLAMRWSGIDLDRVSLGALILALGLLVDDAIIAIEMMIVKLEEGWDRIAAAGHAWNVTARPMLFGTLVTVAGFLPIGFARSGVGEYAGNIFWVLGYALVISWVVAVIFTPYLGVKLLPSYPKREAGHGVYDSPAYQRWRAVIVWCVARRKTVVGATLAALALGVAAMVGPVQKQFFPSSDRSEVLVSIWLPAGSAIGRTDEVARRIEAILAPLPEVRSLSTYVGRGAPRFFISANPEEPDPAFAKIVAVTQGVEAREKVIALLEAHRQAGEFAEARIRVHRLLYGPPVPWPVAFRVVGPDLEELRRLGEEVRAVMARNPHVRDAHLEWNERAPVLMLEAPAERLRAMGLTPREVARQLQFALNGIPVTEVRRDIRTVTLLARGEAAVRDPARLESLELRTLDGARVPLGQVGRLVVRHEEARYKRLDRERFVAVQGEIEGAQAVDVTEALWSALAPLRASLPPGYRIEIGGTVEQSRKADASIQKLQPVMVAVMLILIMLQMREFAGTFMTVATAPLGVIGAAVALLVFDQPFGFVALLGLIGLAGIVMRNTLILTQQVRDNLEAGMTALEAVVEAAVRRTRPVLLTALAAVLAFVPLATDTFWGPLAYVLIGGVMAGTLITLCFVPALYALWYRLPRREMG
ncbi:MAG: efflux RND transporter permease subunit [Tepidiphilus sp.]|jgi:multidrug efflux pump subunit AcrB|nr:efflux RND transporter permease subunit [Tepidiphilus sp.]